MSLDRDTCQRMLDSLDSMEFGFRDAVLISGVGAKQLRNAIDRGTLKIGRKITGVDRWVFTTRECIALVVIAELTSHTWTPLAQAAEVGLQIACSFSFWGQSWLAPLDANAKFELTTSQLEYIVFTTAPLDYIVFSEGNDVRVAMRKRDADCAIFDLNGERMAENSGEKVHIRLPFLNLFLKIMTGVTLRSRVKLKNAEPR